MKIGITVDGRPLDQATALEWVYNETGVFHGTSILADALSDAIHQEYGSEERTVLSEKGMREFITTVTAKAVLGAYLRSCLLLKQIENPARKLHLGTLLLNCYPQKGFTPHEDIQNGLTPSESPEERLMDALNEKEDFYEAAEKVAALMEDWVEMDRAGGRYNSAIGDDGYYLVV